MQPSCTFDKNVEQSHSELKCCSIFFRKEQQTRTNLLSKKKKHEQIWKILIILNKSRPNCASLQCEIGRSTYHCCLVSENFNPAQVLKPMHVDNQCHIILGGVEIWTSCFGILSAQYFFFFRVSVAYSTVICQLLLILTLQITSSMPILTLR